MKLYYLLPNLAFSKWPDKNTLINHQIETLITVCKKYPEEDIRSSVMEYHYLPLSDGKDIPEGLQQAIEFTVDAVNSNRKTLIHCYLGRNRSVLVAAIAYSKLTGNSPKEAFRLVKRLRPNALYNEAFEGFLI